VLASNVTDTFDLYKIKAGHGTEKEIGEAMIPYLFQNGLQKIKRRGTTGALPGMKYSYVMGMSSYDVTRDFYSELTLHQLIYIYEQGEGFQLPSYHVELTATYMNNLKDFDDRMKVPAKDHIYSLKNGHITVKSIADTL
jgi:hypothetical protein